MQLSFARGAREKSPLPNRYAACVGSTHLFFRNRESARPARSFTRDSLPNSLNLAFPSVMIGMEERL